jgi:hypothetical protein
VIEDIKASLVFSTLIASGMHMVVYGVTKGADIPFACDVGFLASAFIPIFIAVRKYY